MAIDWGKLRQIAKERLWTEKGVKNLSTPEPKRINVCEEIKCPYAYRISLRASSGCNQYSDAHQCHLLRSRSELWKEATEYFIHSNSDSVNIAELKTENDSFFLDNPKNRESLELQVELGERILYAPFSEETFDLAAYLKQ